MKRKQKYKDDKDEVKRKEKEMKKFCNHCETFSSNVKNAKWPLLNAKLKIIDEDMTKRVEEEIY